MQIYCWVPWRFTFHSMNWTFYTPPHDSGGVLWLHVGHPCVCPSVRESYVRPSARFFFRFRIILVHINGFSPNLVCALMLWRSGLGLLMGGCRQISIMVGYYSLTFLFTIKTLNHSLGLFSRLIPSVSLSSLAGIDSYRRQISTQT